VRVSGCLTVPCSGASTTIRRATISSISHSRLSARPLVSPGSTCVSARLRMIGGVVRGRRFREASDAMDREALQGLSWSGGWRRCRRRFGGWAPRRRRPRARRCPRPSSSVPPSAGFKRQGCGQPLPVSGQRRLGRSQVVELPPIRQVVIEAWQYAARCRGCGTRTKRTYPAGLEPARTFGPGIEALLGYLHGRHHVGHERLAENLPGGVRADHQRGRDRQRAPPAGRAGAADLRGDRRAGPGRPGDRLG